MSPSHLPSLSVILPNYNHGHCVVGALEALLAQSLRPKEILVIDDASSDDSVPIVEAFARSHPAVRLLRNERNLGVMATFNSGLALVTGDYLYGAACDDRVLPGLFEKSIGLLARHPQAGFCCARALVSGPNGDAPAPYHTPVVSSRAAYLSPAQIVQNFERHGAWIVPHTVIYRRQAFLDMGGYEPDLKSCADGFVYHVLSVKFGACYIPEALMLWNQSEDSFCRRSIPDLSSTLEINERMEHMMRTKHPGLFPAEYFTAMRREAFLKVLHYINDRHPGRYDEVLSLWGALGPRSWMNRLFFMAWHGYVGLGRLALKLYHFAAQPSGEQKRIFAEKCRRLVLRRPAA